MHYEMTFSKKKKKAFAFVTLFQKVKKVANIGKNIF